MKGVKTRAIPPRPDTLCLRSGTPCQIYHGKNRQAKFDQNPDLAKLLVDTGDAPLIEGNSWGDTTWGVDSKTGIGSNNLGIILMDTRDNLKE